MTELDGLPRLEFAFPGPLRDKLVAAIMDGAKTSTTGLVAAYKEEDEPLPEPGRQGVLIDSVERTVAVLETVAVETVRLADVSWEHARDEGEGYHSLAEWRTAHESFWHGAEMRELLGDPDFTVDDDTLVVTERFRLVRNLADEHGRLEPAHTSGERATLAGFLDWQRDTLAMKCKGLDADQLKRKSLTPSDLSLLGLVRHLAEIERSWFREVFAGESPGPIWPRVDGEHADFLVDDADPGEAFEAWHAECDRARAIVASHDLGEVVHWRDEDWSLRWIVTHMIEEYARHNGHADLLRERIDGTTGE
ncbi:mycothiol transferase [Actinomadura rupiterrae]|uniref:mycothiol transferase n=1 Tax=Actinomadura rupiterrae TaxID=559627 RepID=UPI0027E22804|nr:DUF664 domain-containing protein [Actinomadura rupiterrae]MCP2340735.1 uncharacterized protein YhfF [Actinomadura rupiterrae]